MRGVDPAPLLWILLLGVSCTAERGSLGSPDGGVLGVDASCQSEAEPSPHRAAPVVKACSSHRECGEGFRCSGGVCIGGPFASFRGSCAADADCKFWQRCDSVRGECVGDPATASWDVETGQCSRERPFRLLAPEGPGPFPIFVFMTGTFGSYADAVLQTHLLEPMAQRGFVSVSVDYANGWPEGLDDLGAGSNNSDGLLGRSRCIFDPGNPDGVVAILDRNRSILGADSSMGIAVSGHSLGAMTAITSQAWTSNVRAIYVTGAGNDQKHIEACGARRDYTSYLNAYARTNLRPEILRIVDGEEDQLFSNVPEDPPVCYGREWWRYPFDAASLRDMMNQMTAGLDCPVRCAPGSCGVECLSSSGSGWIMVGNEQATVTGHADHTFWLSNLETWSTTGEAWGREANLNWMACMQGSSGENCQPGLETIRIPFEIDLAGYGDDCASVRLGFSQEGVLLELHAVRALRDPCSGRFVGQVESHLPEGSYDVSAKQFHRLGRAQRGVRVRRGLETLPFDLDIAGDADGDNRVDASDLSLVRAVLSSTATSYGRLCGAVPPGVPAVGQEPIWMADVNGDGTVSSEDLEEIERSLGNVGEGDFDWE